MLDGSGGFNTLSVNDGARGNTSYQFYADRFYSTEPGLLPSGVDFNYDNMSSIGLTCSNGNNAFAVYSTSSDIPAGNQITIVLSGGNDTATMYPHDAQGSLTINGTIGIVAGTGTDTMIFDDTAANGIHYSFSNPFGGTQDVFGMRRRHGIYQRLRECHHQGWRRKRHLRHQSIQSRHAAGNLRGRR